MSIVAQHVREFKKITGQKPDPRTGAKLVSEESEEWESACSINLHLEDKDYEAELKELADLVYVIYGYADTMGWDLDLAINRVHKNNLARVIQDDGSVKFREDGKVMKRKDAPKVFLGDLV